MEEVMEVLLVLPLEAVPPDPVLDPDVALDPVEP
jgi:hypothetical protein